MRSAGIVLTFLSSLIFGFEMIKPVKRRMELLNKLCRSLELMHAEMTSRPSSLESLCRLLASDFDGTAEFFCGIIENMDELGCKSFREIWNDALNEKLKHLNPDDICAMESLGAVLGNYELSEQLEAIAVCKSRLYNNLLELNATYPANRKLCLGISCSVGAMLVLVLV